MPSEPPRRLHLFSLIRGIDPRSLLQVAPVLAVLGFGSEGRLPAVPLVAVGFVVVAVGRVLLWQRHTYELTETALVERRGLLNRRERTVQLERLQQVEVDRSIIDRMVGTAVLRLETASDASEAELELRVVADEEAQRLRRMLLPHAERAGEPDAPPPRELVHVPLAHVALASVTGRRLLLIPVAVGAAMGLLHDLDLFSEAEDVASDAFVALGIAAVVGLVIVVLVVSVLASLVAGIVRDGDFRIREVGGDLHVTRGLLSTREAVVPRVRLQKVDIRRGWLRRHLGYASLTLHSAGGAGGDPSSERRLIVPLVPADAAWPLVRALLPESGALPALRRHPPHARRRARLAYLLPVTPALPLVASGAWVTTGRLDLVGLVVVAVVTAVVTAVAAAAWWLGGREHANRASAVDDRWVVARHGALAITESVCLRDKAQGTAVVIDPFQRRLGLASLIVHVAGPGAAVRMRDLTAVDARTYARHIDHRWPVPPERVGATPDAAGPGPVGDAPEV